ncbi:MAG: hypothetical protein M3431_01240 [Actinomycetota bacterium]|nr:hypothetical protein [Actinomycetota bacterium]
MTEQRDPTADNDHDVAPTVAPGPGDQRDGTAPHPTGDRQAEENAENDPPA